MTEAWTSSRPVSSSHGHLRPGRLVAVTACQDRHETPGTHLGRAQWPPIVPVPIARPNPAVPRSPTSAATRAAEHDDRDLPVGLLLVSGELRLLIFLDRVEAVAL